MDPQPPSEPVLAGNPLDLSADKLCVRELEREDGTCLAISQCQVGDVGCVVWDAALVLAHYLDCPSMVDPNSGRSRLEGKSVIELGAGTGIVGLQASACGADCVLTDLADFLPLMELNISSNQSLLKGKISAKRLDWGCDVTSFVPPHPDYVLLADCIYYEQSLEPLVRTVTELSGLDTVVLCCHEKRTMGNKPMLERKFFELLSESFNAEDIPLEEQHPLFCSDDIRLVRLLKKRTSS